MNDTVESVTLAAVDHQWRKPREIAQRCAAWAPTSIRHCLRDLANAAVIQRRKVPASRSGIEAWVYRRIPGN